MNITEGQSQRIQILRGLAIIAVVFIHNTPVGLLQVWIRPLLNFCVGTFLFLSGLLSNRHKWNPKKRVIKVFIPYVFWTLIYTVSDNLGNLSSVPLDYLKNLITGKSAPMMYYVFVYCELTLLIPFIDKIARSRYKYLAFAVAPVEIVVMRLLPIVMGIELNKYIVILRGNSCLGWFVFFYLGYLLGNGLIDVHISDLKLAVGTVCGIALQVMEAYWYRSMGTDNCGTQMKLSALLTGTAFVMLAYSYIMSRKVIPNGKSTKILYTLGNHSFGIFFCHIAVMRVLQRIPGYSHYAVYPICAVIGVLASLLIVVVGKKIMGKYAKYVAL